jgi:hypothetical protein
MDMTMVRAVNPMSERIRRMKLDELGIDHRRLNVIRRDYASFADQKMAPSLVVPVYALTIGDYIDAYGDWPRYVVNRQGNRYRWLASLKTMQKILLDLGMTPRDWPMLGRTLRGIYQAHIDNCHGNKTLIGALPALVLGISRIQMQKCMKFKKDKAIDDCVLTISELLHFKSSQSYLTKQNDWVFRDCILAARAQLRSLGFNAQDGVFLNQEEDSTTLRHVQQYSKIPYKEKTYS